MMRRPDVNYVSVKLSSVVSQLLTIDHEGSLERVGEKLRVLYRGRRGPSGHSSTSTWRSSATCASPSTPSRRSSVNPSSRTLSAGIVLQAYLPESHAALDELIAFAKRRRRAAAARSSRSVSSRAPTSPWSTSKPNCTAGAPRPTPPRPTSTRATCASSTSALRPEHAAAMRVGVASHNLFHLSWALEVAEVARRARPARRRDARRHGQRARRSPLSRAASRSCSTRRSLAATTSRPRSPTSCAASTRTPRPRTTCARRSSSRTDEAVFDEQRGASSTHSSQTPQRRGVDAASTRRSSFRRTLRERARRRPDDPSLRARGRERVSKRCARSTSYEIDTLAHLDHQMPSRRSKRVTTPTTTGAPGIATAWRTSHEIDRGARVRELGFRRLAPTVRSTSVERSCSGPPT